MNSIAKFVTFFQHSHMLQSRMLGAGWSDMVVEDYGQHRPASVLKITTTVKSLLRRLRGSSKVRYLWIDALCNNQADDEEKSYQVSRMFEIYRSATQVFAWLGDDGGDFLDILKRMSTEGDEVLEHCLEERGLGPLHFFLETRWFGRRWVIQEIAAARKAVIVCGQAHMDFDALAQTLRTSNLSRRIAKSHTLGVIEAIAEVLGTCAYSHQLSFAAWLPVFHTSECADDRERIYSLLGLDSLLSDRESGFIMTPNYGLSTTACYDIFATSLAARSTQDLFALLQCAGAFPQEHVAADFEPLSYGDWEHAPSWVPDWTFPRLFRPLFCSQNSLRAGRTAVIQPISTRYSHDQRVIRLDGSILGRITHLSLEWVEQGIDDMYMMHHVLGWWLVLLESGLADKPNYAGQSERIISSFARAITAGQVDLLFEPVSESQTEAVGSQQHTSKERSRKAFCDLLTTWLRRAKLLHGESDDLVTLARDSSLDLKHQYRLILTTCFAEEHIPPDAHPEIRRVHQFMEGRTFFVTDSGYMGICSMWAALGDVVGVPFGANTPFVFRSRDGMRRDQEERRVTLVSDCYVAGVMDGQAFEQPGFPRCSFVVE
jgi:hypothetical protein